jgi:hypothetical protein
MEHFQYKSLLAKLMASENLIVEQRNVKTASFDTKNRILTVPILDSNISPDLYDLLIGHEVGHALYTPFEGLVTASEMNLTKSVLNVIEDARIERKIKTKYPGIRQGFIRGYKQLIEKNFFGTEGVDTDTLNFIDRANLYFKSNQIHHHKFSSYEQTLISLIENTATFDDVLEVTQKVMDYLKEEQEKRTADQPTNQDDSGEYEEFDGSDEHIYQPPPKASTGDPDDDAEDEEDFEESEEDEGLGFSSRGGDDYDNTKKRDEIVSHTDEAFNINQSKLFASNVRYEYANVPDILMDKVVVDYKKVISRSKDFYEKIKSMDNDSEYRTLESKNHIEDLNKIIADTKKVVAYLAKEFELRKNAEQTKRASVAKTGDLNVSKLYAYKFSEDIFKKITVVPGGKSHGLIMFIDWSGSMCDHLTKTVKQLISLTMFCRRVCIPFEVYAFTNKYYEEDRYQIEKVKVKKGDIHIHDFNLLNIFSSRMSSADFHYSMSMLIAASKLERRQYYSPIPVPNWLHLGGTPLNEAIFSAMKIVPDFKKKYKLSIVNTVFLTDGEAGHINSVYVDYENNVNYNLKKIPSTEYEFNRETGKTKSTTVRLVLTDPVTKNQVIIDDPENSNAMTSGCVKLLKAHANCNVIGFYILSNREFRHNSKKFFSSSANLDRLYAEFKKDNYCITTTAGYDEYYLLRTDGFDEAEETSFEVKEKKEKVTTRNLVSAFKKYTGARLNSRVVLNRFIGMIA